MHRKLLLCLAFVGLALSVCFGNGGKRDGNWRPDKGEECDPSAAINAQGGVAQSDCCDSNCKFRSSLYDCRVESNRCFTTAQCTGDSSTCPSRDSLFNADADCDDAPGECFFAPKCNGETRDGTCLAAEPKPAPEEGVEGSGHQCGPDGNVQYCTIDTYCDGAGVCPSPYAPATLKCADAPEGKPCAKDSYCPGPEAPEEQQYACPEDVFYTTEEAQVCQEAVDEDCIAETICDGTSGDCPEANAASDEVMCDESSEDATTCTGQSYCSGTASGSAECLPSAAPVDTECDPSTEDATTCTGKSYCTGEAAGSEQCIAAAAEVDTECDPSTEDSTTCTGKSYCTGEAAGSAACVAAAAEIDTECNAGTEDAEACVGKSYCTGNAAGVDECVAAVAGNDVECREATVCAYAQNCDGENTGCPSATEFPDTETDCSSTCANEDETAKCDGAGECGICEHEGATADPLITGFHHQKFWFEGDAGSYYNFFSQPGVEINCLISKANAQKKLTVVGAVGFVSATNMVSFDAVNGPLGIFNVNGKNVTFTTKQNMLDINDCIQMAWAPSSVLFSSAEFEFVFAFKAANPKEGLTIPYINTKFAHISGDVSKMSGVIGYTATAKNARLAVAEAKVTGIFAHDSAKNTFAGAALACEQGAKARSDNKMGAASQHQLDDLKKFSWAWA